MRFEFFESAAESAADCVWRDVDEVRRVSLGEQTRVFFQDGRPRWRAGRVVGGGPDIYFVRVPNLRVDVDVAESLCEFGGRRPRATLQVLLSRANETPRFRDAREPVRRLLLAERAATASATGIASAGVRIQAHQISPALRIIRDPVQRYLLADEVGMGKTIQAVTVAATWSTPTTAARPRVPAAATTASPPCPSRAGRPGGSYGCQVVCSASSWPSPPAAAVSLSDRKRRHEGRTLRGRSRLGRW